MSDCSTQMDVNYDIFMLLNKWNKAMQQEFHAANTIAWQLSHLHRQIVMSNYRKVLVSNVFYFVEEGRYKCICKLIKWGKCSVFIFSLSDSLKLRDDIFCRKLWWWHKFIEIFQFPLCPVNLSSRIVSTFAYVQL